MLTPHWPALDDLNEHVAGVLAELCDGQYHARVHLPVKRAQPGGPNVYAAAVGPTFTGRTRREAFRYSELWVTDYLNLAYGVTFRVCEMDAPDFNAARPRA